MATDGKRTLGRQDQATLALIQAAADAFMARVADILADSAHERREGLRSALENLVLDPAPDGGARPAPTSATSPARTRRVRAGRTSDPGASRTTAEQAIMDLFEATDGPVTQDEAKRAVLSVGWGDEAFRKRWRLLKGRMQASGDGFVLRRPPTGDGEDQRTA